MCAVLEADGVCVETRTRRRKRLEERYLLRDVGRASHLSSDSGRYTFHLQLVLLIQHTHVCVTKVNKKYKNSGSVLSSVSLQYRVDPAVHQYISLSELSQSLQSHCWSSVSLSSLLPPGGCSLTRSEINTALAWSCRTLTSDPQTGDSLR